MGWNDKYWDIIRNLYWTPRYLGLQSISRDKWRIKGDWISVPASSVPNPTGPLYSRARKIDALTSYLEGQEEILNHFFNLVFAIAADAVISRLFVEPFGIEDAGPFQSLGREIGMRYGWRERENVTQQDGLFVSASSVIGIELKLGSTSWPEQIAKYTALMLWEEEKFGPRENLALLFIVKEDALHAHWTALGLEGPSIGPDFLSRLSQDRLPKQVQALFAAHPEKIRAIFERLRLAAISWTEFCRRIQAFENGLDQKSPGDQTLRRLLAGLRDQIAVHDGKAIRGREGELFGVVDGVRDRHLHDAILARGEEDVGT
jgi:hypothetical protein